MSTTTWSGATPPPCSMAMLFATPGNENGNVANSEDRAFR